MLVTTYSCLSSKGGKGGSRLQVVDRGGGDYDGCLLFDESHCAKNLIADLPGTETAAAQAVDAIQHMLLNARVVYCSATAASEAAAPRLHEPARLWVRAVRSRRRPPPTRATRAPRNFIKTCQSRVGAMSSCALHLKREGASSRGRCPTPGAEFSVVEATLTPEQIETYDRAAQLWQILFTRVEARRRPWPCGSRRLPPGDSDEFARLTEVYKGRAQELPLQLWSGHPHLVAHHVLQGAQARSRWRSRPSRRTSASSSGSSPRARPTRRA